jgi:hypothetical protein
MSMGAISKEIKYLGKVNRMWRRKWLTIFWSEM